MDLRRLLVAGLVLPKVNRRIANDPADDAFVAEDIQPTSPRGSRIAPADPIDPQVAVLADVLHDETDLVGMSWRAQE